MSSQQRSGPTATPTRARTTMTGDSGNGSNSGGGGTNNANLPPSSNPFDFDVDFEKVQRRRQAAADKKARERGETLLQGMDAEDTSKDLDPTSTAPKLATTKSAMANLTGARQIGLNWFRGGKDHSGDDLQEEKAEILYGGKRVVQWPFDDYHTVQQQYYIKLEERTNAAAAAADHGDRQEAKDDQPSRASSGMSFQRPPDPPDIPTAVMNLHLSEFEQKAEERAIAIVSTWLFDAGLIDELLVHGGMGEATARGGFAAITSSGSVTGMSAVDDPSVKSSEGVEIGAHGFPLEGASKMDREIAKLRSTTQRQLALINARLNDGVAASGGEVQELVNAVMATKEDLGRLRELSTYISNTGDVERSSKFMLTRYPKLKKAINARRNLARCFRELDFYSQIPVTCDRLREELHSGEWTDHEWTSLRNVAREHVELEIFLVEAEAGMKKRIDEEREENEANDMGGPRKPTSRRRTSNSHGASRFNRTSFAHAGLPHNYEEVDNFLHEHVKNVWELGDEIRLRIMSGIGAAFDLAMNNPSGLVALVEAVEVYETANEEYRTVHGEEAGTSHTLRFTDMRAAALGQIYQDFELRGLEVFREVHEGVRVHISIPVAAPIQLIFKHC